MNIGSTRGMVGQNQSAVTDEQGNPIVNAGNGFGDSPAGNALLTQALFGLPNGTLSLTPPDVYSPISSDNRVPYWEFLDYSNGVMAGSAVYDATTQTWGVIINPGTAASAAYCTFTTRSYLVNDDNLGLRQRATTVITKGGTAAAGTAWNLTLTSTYFDATNTAVSTAIIGTVYDANTWTSISGFTTSGGSAVTASARYVDLEYKLTATAAITGSATVTIKSLFLATKIGANASFNVADVYTANATWTRPTGVDYVTVVAIGGGGGGPSGGMSSRNTTGTAYTVSGGSGGGGSRVAYLPNFYVGDQTTVAIGIGAGGSGGTANVFTKSAASTNTSSQNGAAASSGGATTFGSFLTVNGGGAGVRGTVYTSTVAAGPAGGTAAGASTTSIFSLSDSIGGAGGVAGSAGTASDAANAAFAPGTSTVQGVTLLPLVQGTYSGAGAAGGTVTATYVGFTPSQNYLGAAGTGGASGFIAGGGSGGGLGIRTNGTLLFGAASSGGTGGAGGAGGNIASPHNQLGSGTATIVAGTGGSASAYSGAGGGAGGAILWNGTGSVRLDLTTGVGGVGGGGLLVVGYTA